MRHLLLFFSSEFPSFANPVLTKYPDTRKWDFPGCAHINWSFTLSKMGIPILFLNPSARNKKHKMENTFALYGVGYSTDTQNQIAKKSWRQVNPRDIVCQILHRKLSIWVSFLDP